MINPMQMMMQAMQGGQSPMQFLAQASGQNPVFQQMQQITQGKTPQQLMQIAENMAKERGTTLQAVAQQMGLPFNR